MTPRSQYRVLRPIVLSFLTPQDQYDAFIDPPSEIETDGATIWLKAKGRLKESITTPNAIAVWLKQGDIKETIVT